MHSTIRWRGERHMEVGVSGPIAVVVIPGPALPPDSAHFAQRLLGIVHEFDAQAEVVQGTEASALRLAREHGARFLLVATVLRWRDAQTQYYAEPDRIGIDLRVTQVQTGTIVRDLNFETRSSPLAVRNAPADRLLNEKFRQAVRQVLGSQR